MYIDDGGGAIGTLENKAAEKLPEGTKVMHQKAGDRFYISNRFGTETVTIRSVYKCPHGGIAYGFYSSKAGRNLMECCNCKDCAPLHKQRTWAEIHNV